MSAPKPCKVGTCDRPKKKGKHFCEWHWLARQSSDVQALAAKNRLNLPMRPSATHRARVPAAEWPTGERWCAGCQSFVPLFYISGSRCRACNSMAAHAKRLEKTYGIDAAEYDRLFKLQGGRCAICRNLSRSIRFAVDHDHETGAVRGLLCKRCNHDLLGGGHDSIDLLWRAVKYLLSPPAQEDRPVSDMLALGALREHLQARAQAAAPRRPEPQEPPF